MSATTKRLSGSSALRLGMIGCSTPAAAKQAAACMTIPGVRLAGVFDPIPEAARLLASNTTQVFDSVQGLLTSGEVDAVVLHTPLSMRVAQALAAIDAGLHVLVERPLAATVRDASLLVDRHKAQLDPSANPGGVKSVFAVNLTMRLRPVWSKVQQLIDSGELGQLVRVHWTLADQFRAHAFYQSQPGRGTFKHDGGGLLLGQYHANLDLLTFLLGSPTHVDAVVRFGRFHPIEVEDEVFASLEYASGTLASIVASTAEPMGNNRLEIIGSNAMLRVTCGRKIEVVTPSRDMNAQLYGDNPYGDRQVTVREIGVSNHSVDAAAESIKAFVNAIRGNKAHPSPACDNLTTLQVCNAILFSGIRKRRVGVPVDADEFAELFDTLCGPR